MSEHNDELPAPVIKKVKKVVGGGHHGGAWKVAYADFVTAMMAFFLLLWLLNVTTEQQKDAISNYFDPTHPKISETTSGAGGILAGTSIATQGAMSNTRQPMVEYKPTTPTTGSLSANNENDGKKRPSKRKSKARTTRERFVEALKRQEQAKFQQVAEELKKAIENNKELAEFVKNLMIDITPEGLRIQLIDQDGRSMFPLGSARLYDYTRKLLGEVASIAKPLPNQISVRGHTDGIPYKGGGGYTNWELSADRANASRRALLEENIPGERVSDIQGRADKEHLYPDDPTDARNRRISILLLNQDFSNTVIPPELEHMFEEQAEEEEAAGSSGGTIYEDDVTFSDDDTGEYEELDSETSREIERRIEQLYQKSSGSVEFP
jgi:chemotaxis protein MotB